MPSASSIVQCSPGVRAPNSASARVSILPPSLRNAAGKQHGVKRRRCRRSRAQTSARRHCGRIPGTSAPAPPARNAARFDARRNFAAARPRVNVQVSTRAEESVLRRRPSADRARNRARRQRELRDFRTAIAFQIESGRSTGRMIAALVLCLDDQRPALAGNLRAEARTGDPAANDHDIEIDHSPRRLRIGKPRRLVVTIMFNATFTELLLLALAAILVVAAVIDVRTFTISNRLNLTVALLAPLYWASVALSPWPGIAVQLAARRDRLRAARRRFLRRDDGRRRRQARGRARALVPAVRRRSNSWC